ncbi:HMA2 domain-containing protein [Nostoc sp. FACHB-110]|uniref:HMA2 domain-containing protein n=1 Tax=Nostoc sp. FACHB-110 TaxID=2692834 RepID=UPI001686A501|nr:hypothetical protein [Nostoc sp. FACHB-110]MBD2439075.1 hypothetical protein [Nostoc sp. FACHB-110]
MKQTSPLELQIVSNTPGRLRLKIASQAQESLDITEIANTLEYLFPQVKEIKTNIQVGSITIYYSGGNETLRDAFSKLQDSGINLLNAPAKKLQPASITRAVSQFNQQIKQTTKDTIDLRLLVSFSIIAFAIKRLLPQLARWQSTILYLLLWSALESLFKISDNQETPNE